MLVESHLRAVSGLAAGVASLPSAGSAFAATQAAWRFLNNERVSFPALVEPLREAGRRGVAESQAKFVLLAHDWCKLGYAAGSKRDLVQLTHQTDIGYELTTTLLISAGDGCPLAPMEMHLKTAQGVLSTRNPGPRHRAHLEQVLPTMQASETWDLSKPIVHVIDREADSVDHYRRWDADGHKFLIRADDRRVRWRSVSCTLSEIRAKLRQKQRFRPAGPADYHGRKAALWIAETEAVLDRPAKKNVAGKKFQRAGRPLELRLVVVEVRDAEGKVLAHWLLLSNVPPEWATSALGPRLLLALANRKFFQAAQESRPTTGTLAARNRARDLPATLDRRDGVCRRVAIASRRIAGRSRTENRVGSVERTADESASVRTPPPRCWRDCGLCFRCSPCWNITTFAR